MDFKELWQKVPDKWKPFSDKWARIIIWPRAFFSEWDHNEDYKHVIIFNIICGVLAGVLKTILTFGGEFSAIIRCPLTLMLLTFVGGSVFYLFLKLSGGEGDIEPTIKMVGYTQAIGVFSYGIPTLGPLIGLYQIWLLTVIGEVLHKLDTRRSLIAVLLPIALFMFIMIMISTILGLKFFGGILSHENQMF
ncbi:YIP1 family protein [Desulfonema magnum]|uniref:Yip1 domain-containing protein n=1 Tax=Desulfonema magnum TaxID=45655 RepID=A0A975BLY4_9BACT|nr:YIP1 family protein [Desulfonema magnum]QTA87662.1 Yip1 domain-containing protein [Desulfonema magnum]